MSIDYVNRPRPPPAKVILEKTDLGVGDRIRRIGSGQSKVPNSSKKFLFCFSRFPLDLKYWTSDKPGEYTAAVRPVFGPLKGSDLPCPSTNDSVRRNSCQMS